MAVLSYGVMDCEGRHYGDRGRYCAGCWRAELLWNCCMVASLVVRMWECWLWASISVSHRPSSQDVSVSLDVACVPLPCLPPAPIAMVDHYPKQLICRRCVHRIIYIDPRSTARNYQKWYRGTSYVNRLSQSQGPSSVSTNQRPPKVLSRAAATQWPLLPPSRITGRARYLSSCLPFASCVRWRDWKHEWRWLLLTFVYL